MNGVLLRAPQSRFGERVYYCVEGRRHWVYDGNWLSQFGFRWPDDVHDVSADILEAFRVGRQAARRWSESDRAVPIADDALTLREICLSGLFGTGIEFGPGAAPLPIPLDCVVRYADVYTLAELKTNSYAGQDLRDLTEPDLCSSFERLEGLDDRSVDFIAASHVIEHTADPIGAIVRSAKKLRSGGNLALIVPDKQKTFDRARPTTPLEHVIEDFRDPSRDRDKLNFQEFYSLAFPQSPAEYETVWQKKWDEAFPIHYHAWTYEMFAEMVRWIQVDQNLFSRVWSHYPVNLKEAIEFYFVLTVD